MDYSHCMYNLCEMLEIMYQRLESSPPIIIASSLRIDAKVQVRLAITLENHHWTIDE